MNRLLAILLICFSTAIIAQDKRNYLVGIEAWGGYKRSMESDTTGFNSKNLSSFITTTLYGGKFVAANLALFGSFTITPGKSSTDYNYPNNQATNYYGTSNSISFGIGARKYYGFSTSDVVGLLLNLESLYSVSKYKNSFKSKYNNVLTEETTEIRRKSIDAIFSPGIYINFNKNWQTLLRFGGAFYKHTWGEEVVNASGNTLQPKSSSMGVSFNIERFGLSVVRFL